MTKTRRKKILTTIVWLVTIIGGIVANYYGVLDTVMIGVLFVGIGISVWMLMYALIDTIWNDY